MWRLLQAWGRLEVSGRPPLVVDTAKTRLCTCVSRSHPKTPVGRQLVRRSSSVVPLISVSRGATGGGLCATTRWWSQHTGSQWEGGEGALLQWMQTRLDLPVVLFSQPRNRLAPARYEDCRPDNACSGTTSSNKVRSPSPNRTGVNGGWGPNPLTTGWRPRQAQVSGGREPSAVTARGPSWRFGNRQGIREGPNCSMCSHPSLGYTTLHYPGPARPLTQPTHQRRITQVAHTVQMV